MIKISKKNKQTYNAIIMRKSYQQITVQVKNCAGLHKGEWRQK